MLSWIARALIRRTYESVNRGDVAAVVKMVTDEVTMTFPGSNRWGRVYRGKREIEGFVRELIDLGLTFTVHDVLVKGPPWNMTMVVLLSDRATDTDGNVVYENRAVEYGRGKWFKINSLEVFEDTEKATAWDRYLSANAPATA